MSALETELTTYKKLLPNLLSKSGQYALIHDSELVDTYESYEDALKVGYDKFGLTPFLVKQILSEDNISFFSRDIGYPCPA